MWLCEPSDSIHGSRDVQLNSINLQSLRLGTFCAFHLKMSFSLPDGQTNCRNIRTELDARQSLWLPRRQRFTPEKEMYDVP